MKKLISKYISILLAMVLLGLNIVGCNNGNVTSENDNTAKGRYVETKLELPQDIDNQYVFQMEKSEDGYPVLYSSSKDKSGKGVRKYTQKENGEWERSSVKWLEDVSITRLYGTKLISGENGEVYFYYREETADGHLGNIHLLKKVDENNAQSIKLEGWDKLDLDSDVPTSIAVLKNGNIVCSHGGSHIIIYDKETYKIVSDSNNKGDNITIYGENYLLFTSDEDNQEPGSISSYDSNSKLVNKVKFDKTNAIMSFDLCVDNDNSIVMSNNDGIHVLSQDTKLWEIVVDGTLTSLNSPSLYSDTIIKGNEKVYYVLFKNTTDGVELMKYSYDTTISSKPKIELSVYSLEDNKTVKQAAIAFQRNNPEVKINFRFSMDQNNATNKTDYIKSLNTELLSGKGSDIIILDGLPVDSYIEKGGLADISDIINPMFDSNELASNIMNNCKTGDKIYSVPIRYGIPIVYGNTEVVNSTSNLDDLVNYSTNHKGEKLFGRISYSDLVKQFLPINLTDFYDRKGTFNKDELVKFLNKEKIISDNIGCVAQYSEGENKSDGVSLASDAKVVLSNSKGIFDTMLDISAVDYVKGSFTSYKNTFTPIGEVGINASSKQIELSKQFIKTLLSTEIQDEDFLEGFPVNNKSLENQYNCDDYGLITILSIKNADGTASDFNITWPKKDRMDNLMDICKKVSTETANDDVLFGMIVGETDDFFAGNKTAEETADAIINKTKVYIAE